MNFRTAKKIIDRWSRGQGNYYLRFEMVVRAHCKLVKYYERHKVDYALPGLPDKSYK